jgi:hypothetical protein
MHAAFLLRVGSEALHGIMGGITVFCLIYADLYPFLAEHLLKYVLFFGPLAAAVAYFKERYLG